MRNPIFVSIIVLILAACQPSAPSADIIQTAIAQTHEAEPSPIPPNPIVLPTSTVPPIPTTTIKPSPTANAVVPLTSENHFAWNFIASQESGDILVEIARIVISEKNAAGQKFGNYKIYDDKPNVGEIVFRITNKSDKILSIYPDQGTIVVGNEQIDLREYMISSTFGDDLGGEIYPGVTKIGGIWFGIKRTALGEIQSITIAFSNPTDNEFNSYGEDFLFIIDLSNRQNEPLPDELK